MRRRYLYTMNGVPLPEPIEVTPDFQSHAERSGATFMVDRYMEGIRATDGTDIGSRAKRREYMKANGLADAADYKETWEKAAKERAAFYRGEDKTDYKTELAAAWERSTNGRKR